MVYPQKKPSPATGGKPPPPAGAPARHLQADNARRIRLDAEKYRKETEIKARSQAQLLVLRARQIAEKELAEMKSAVSQELQNLLAEMTRTVSETLQARLEEIKRTAEAETRKEVDEIKRTVQKELQQQLAAIRRTVDEEMQQQLNHIRRIRLAAHDELEIQRKLTAASRIITLPDICQDDYSGDVKTRKPARV